MPTHKVKGGYKWGKHGKVYPTKKQADKQAQAIYASGWKESKINEIKNKNIMKKQLIRLTEGDLHKIIEESVNRILNEYTDNDKGIGEYNKYNIEECLKPSIKEAFSDYYNVSHFADPNKDYYNGFVIVDGTRAVVGNYDNYEEAVEDAKEMAHRYKGGTFEVYGCDEDGYALEEDYPEDNTLVYSTDEDFA